MVSDENTAGKGNGRKPTVRVFFALWPDPAVRAALHRTGHALHRALGGKLTRADSVHMTLLFLGAVPEERVARLLEIPADVAFERFSMHLDVARCWRHNDLAWVGPSRMPPALAQLVRDLDRTVGEAGFAFDRRDFAAHVTLVRKARCRDAVLDAPDINWPVSDFVLTASELDRDGSRYRVIGRWPAAGTAATTDNP